MAHGDDDDNENHDDNDGDGDGGDDDDGDDDDNDGDYYYYYSYDDENRLMWLQSLWNMSKFSAPLAVQPRLGDLLPRLWRWSASGQEPQSWKKVSQDCGADRPAAKSRFGANMRSFKALDLLETDETQVVAGCYRSQMFEPPYNNITILFMYIYICILYIYMSNFEPYDS